MNDIPLYGVLGWPVAHSRSPGLQQYWFKKYQQHGAYVHLPVRPELLSIALPGLVAAGFRGFNVTVPHKETIRRLLDTEDGSVTQVGACNTILVDEATGHLKGYNTDAAGFAAALTKASAPRDFKGAKAAILGSGGAARAAICALLQLGANIACILTRNSMSAAQLCADFSLKQTRVIALEGLSAELSVDILVNTTPLGMTGQPPLRFPWPLCAERMWVIDCVYTPIETVFLKEARAHGHNSVDGSGMFLGQAAAAFKLWTGIEPEIDAAARALALGQAA